ncbi:MAG: CBS domain-containing protein [Elusimicrobia bacterium]|nr:CBS domain-containing protein [Elusimicrobiota bacterium]
MRDDRRVTDALAIMTRTRLGAASVVDARGRLVGVFTDGDLRRGLQKDPRLLAPPFVANHDPVAPHHRPPRELAADVAPLFPQTRVGQFPRRGRAAASARRPGRKGSVG